MNKIFTPSSASFLILAITLSALSPQLLRAKTAPTVGYFGDPVFLEGPIGQALGGAVYSLNTDTHDALLVNPSSAAFSSVYAADGTFSTASRTIGTSVFDTKSTSYGGGFTYLRREVDSDAATKILRAGSVQEKYQNFGVSLFGKLQDSFSIGVTGKYSIRSGTGPADLNDTTWNGDVGATFRINEKIAIGAVYKNIFGDKNNIEAPMLGGGAHIEVLPGLKILGSAEKYFNASSTPKIGYPDDSQFSWSLAAQYNNESGIVGRAAFRNAGPWKSNMVFAGLGYANSQFHIDYALGTVTKGDKFVTHTFGIGATF